MAPNPRRTDARLQALYDQLPALRCRGLCSDSCGPIEMSVRERERIERAAGQRVECGAGASCSMLTEDRRCGVYDLRPLICRLWGVVESLPCPYGCRPDGGYLTNEESARLMAEVDVVGGDPGGRERRLRAVLDDDATLKLAASYVRRTTPRPSIAGRAGAMPRTVLDR